MQQEASAEMTAVHQYYNIPYAVCVQIKQKRYDMQAH